MKNKFKIAMPIIFFIFMIYCGCVPIVYPFSVLNRQGKILRGTVVDQNGDPIPGARLRFEEWENIFLWPLYVHVRPTTPRFATSDVNGTFQIKFYLDRLELVSGSKKHHLLDREMGDWYWSNDKHSSAQGKILFYNFTRTSPSHARAGITPWFDFGVNGENHFVNFSTESMATECTEGSNLVFSIKRLGDERFMLTMRGIKGGVIGSAHELPFAPQYGYVPGFSSFYTQTEWTVHGGTLGFFLKSHDGAFHARVVSEINNKLPRKLRFHYIANDSGTGNRFLFTPDPKNPFDGMKMYGWRGPLKVHITDLTNTGVYRTLYPEPWWFQNQYHMYPLMSHADFERLLPPYDRKNWPTTQVRMYLAKQIHAPASVLDDLSHPGRETQSIVAENPGAPRELLEWIALNGEEKWGAEAARKNLDKQSKRGLFIGDYLKSRNNFQEECK